MKVKENNINILEEIGNNLQNYKTSNELLSVLRETLPKLKYYNIIFSVDKHSYMEYCMGFYVKKTREDIDSNDILLKILKNIESKFNNNLQNEEKEHIKYFLEINKGNNYVYEMDFKDPDSQKK